MIQKNKKKVGCDSAWHPVKWTRKYNKIFRELFVDFWQTVLPFFMMNKPRLRSVGVYL